MSLSDVFMSQLPRPAAPLAGLAARAEDAPPAPTIKISGFVTVASFTNFSAMSGAIAGAWLTLKAALPQVAWIQGPGLPFVLALAWCLISLRMSWQELKKSGGDGAILQALFMGLLNALVLAGSAIGLLKVAP